MTKRKTYVLEVTSTHRYGLNQDYYYRKEEEAKKEMAEMKVWFKNSPHQKFRITSHNFTS